MSNPKILAMYLPQYHCIPENDKFWGNGFTDWTTVKKAKPLFEGHRQPRIPKGHNYYDLSLVSTVKWQAKLAREYGIYGFGIYHYWFNDDKNLLTKPAEIILENKDIDINYFFSWDNANWKRSWSNVVGNAWAPIADSQQNLSGPEILIPYILGKEKQWERHYNYLRRYFADKRYIKINGKPIFCIWNYNSNLIEMCNYWDKLAQNDGYPGVHIIFRYGLTVPKRFTQMIYEPITAGWSDYTVIGRSIMKIKQKFGFLPKPSEKKLRKLNYQDVWKKIVIDAQKRKQQNILHGAFVSYDDTPRHGSRGNCIIGESPELFKKYMSELMKITKQQKKEYIFLTAWNEWGEGAYMEPDENNGMSYLTALKQAVEEFKM